MVCNAYCNACLLKKRLGDHPADAAPEAIEAYRRRVRSIVGDNPNLSSPEKDYEISRVREAMFGPGLDYGPIKRHFNGMLMALYPAMLAEARRAPDPLRRAVQYAMTGNFIDFAAMDSVDEGELRAKIAESDRIPVDAGLMAAFRADVCRAKRLCYIADNCGEIVMDRVLLQIIADLNPACEITAVVKGAPVVNDATREDAEQVRLGEVVRRVVDTGWGIAGCPEGRLSEDCAGAMAGADLLIAKGQANYETLCGCGLNLYYIFMCKCELFMDRFHVPRFSGIMTAEK